MAIRVTYPGVYVEEIPSGVRTIAGVSTSTTAFVGRTLRGPTDTPITINNFGDFERKFGGLWKDSSLGYAVQDFYLNEGQKAIIVRLFEPEKDNSGNPILAKSRLKIGGLVLEAASEGKWGEKLRGEIDLSVLEETAMKLGVAKSDLFNLKVWEEIPGGITEEFRNLTIIDSPRQIARVLEENSRLVRWSSDNQQPQIPSNVTRDGISNFIMMLAEKDDSQSLPGLVQLSSNAIQAEIDVKEAEVARDRLQKEVDDLTAAGAPVPQPLQDQLTAANNDVQTKTTAVTTANAAIASSAYPQELQAYKETKVALTASDGQDLTKDTFIGKGKEGNKKGLYALKKAGYFSILIIEPIPYQSYKQDVYPLVAAAATFCEKQRAFYLVNPPSEWTTKEAVQKGLDKLGTNSKNAAVFFPMLKKPDPLREGQMGTFSPVGTVAGVFARTDSERGVWKAPAGTDATLRGVPELLVPLTDEENGDLNPLGVNCLRNIPPYQRIIWGARTLQGDDRMASEWQYIPVRRLALFIEESLYQGTHWVVFEPNDEPLWAQIRLNVGAFMSNLYRQGAFQGSSPKEAYFVKCDKETTTQNDINLGIVNIIVGFAPLKPAEFVILKLQQIAGQINT